MILEQKHVILVFFKVSLLKNHWKIANTLSMIMLILCILQNKCYITKMISTYLQIFQKIHWQYWVETLTGISTKDIIFIKANSLWSYDKKSNDNLIVSKLQGTFTHMVHRVERGFLCEILFSNYAAKLKLGISITHKKIIQKMSSWISSNGKSFIYRLASKLLYRSNS